MSTLVTDGNGEAQRGFNFIRGVIGLMVFILVLFLLHLASARSTGDEPVICSSEDFISYSSVGDQEFPGTYVLKFKGRSNGPTAIDFSLLLPADLTAGDLEIACPETNGFSAEIPGEKRLSYTGTAPGPGTYLLKASFRPGRPVFFARRLPTVLVCVGNPE